MKITCRNLISIRTLRNSLFKIIIYYCATFSWYSLECSWDSKCTRILLVADPQLIGLHNENNRVLTPISIWDSDRYLAKTFSYAFHFTKPDVVIFLGDLFDEGSTATNPEFNTYLRRLFKIFLSRPFDTVQHIWLPGDNDIGGEFYDRITNQKIKRFEHAFSQPDIIGVKNIKFYKINRLLSLMPVLKGKNDFSNLDTINVALSHIPLILSPALFVDKVLEKLQPHVLFTAHTHNSMIVMMQQEFSKDRLIIPVRPDENQVYEYFLGISDIYEILVPTCSYRMGTDKIGYGYAILENGTLKYTVLWSPSRFLQLKIYLLSIVLVFIYLMVSCICKRCRKRKDNTTPIYSKLDRIA
ncbi:hypothetical protein ILUMI_02164 [Ignelater luminosus]|uniref:Calcineurin-like phosphoesterase domain-containing protein n=1 Tax=Ignelater luminosus TaxID=2038154 RepID=A0A8K0DIS5_IGNLU|nr:hypothetical protein ILUMI_02164 [Ignelater luminosus]